MYVIAGHSRRWLGSCALNIWSSPWKVQLDDYSVLVVSMTLLSTAWGCLCHLHKLSKSDIGRWPIELKQQVWNYPGSDKLVCHDSCLQYLTNSFVMIPVFSICTVFTRVNWRFLKRWRRPQILQFCGDDRRIRRMQVLIRPRLSPYTSIVPTKLQDLRPSPSFTKLPMDREKQAVCSSPCRCRRVAPAKISVNLFLKVNWSFCFTQSRSLGRETKNSSVRPKWWRKLEYIATSSSWFLMDIWKVMCVIFMQY